VNPIPTWIDIACCALVCADFEDYPMRTLTLTTLAMGIVWAAGDAQAQTYDPSAPVCMHVVYPRGGTYQDCSYHTMAQCAASASGRGLIGSDGCRTPMQWNSSEFAGFSAIEPWLPLANNFHFGRS
jgi:Protein of unknown function (DUF3551)